MNFSERGLWNYIKFSTRTFFIGTTLLVGSFCLSQFFFHSPSIARAQNLSPEEEAALRAELSNIESQIKEQQKILSSKESEGVSIERDIAILNAKIKQTQLKIKAQEITINQLGKDIVVKTKTIGSLTDRIQKGKDSLVQVLQKTRELDDYSVTEAVLASRDLSNFFADIDTFASIKDSLKLQIDDITKAKQQNEEARVQLDTKRDQEIDTKVVVEQEKRKVEVLEKEKQRLLALNKNERLNYKTSIANNQKRATDIRNKLFALRDSAAIKFGDAVTYAKQASAKTGVRAAFVLAIIQQESNLGANVGRCLLTDETTGAGIRKSNNQAVANVMKPSRDVQPFMRITKALGRDPFKTVVSCPLNIGYGGAMGPAQFIPSTWEMLQAKVAAALGKSAADPWSPQDAFMASAYYLGDLGASGGGYTAERNAACKYYSGRSCSSGPGSSYGTQVMGRVEKIQADIDILSGN